jgi:hypothetical protein
MTWYAGTCGINSYGLTVYTSYCGQMCVLYRGFGSNGFVTNMQSFPMDDYYRTDIISGVGHLRSDSVLPLVLYTVACNGWGISIVL